MAASSASSTTTTIISPSERKMKLREGGKVSGDVSNVTEAILTRRLKEQVDKKKRMQPVRSGDT